MVLDRLLALLLTHASAPTDQLSAARSSCSSLHLLPPLVLVTPRPQMTQILDFVGHAEGVAARLRELLPLESHKSPVIDVGGAGLESLQALCCTRRLPEVGASASRPC